VLRKQEAEGPGLGEDHKRYCATLVRLQSKSRIQRAWILIYSLQCFRDTRVTFDTETKTGKEQEVKYNWGNWNNNAENKREPHVSVITTTNEPPDARCGHSVRLLVRMLSGSRALCVACGVYLQTLSSLLPASESPNHTAPLRLPTGGPPSLCSP